MSDHHMAQASSTEAHKLLYSKHLDGELPFSGCVKNATVARCIFEKQEK